MKAGLGWFILVAIGGLLWWFGHAVAIRAQRTAFQSLIQ